MAFIFWLPVAAKNECQRCTSPEAGEPAGSHGARFSEPRGRPVSGGRVTRMCFGRPAFFPDFHREERSEQRPARSARWLPDRSRHEAPFRPPLQVSASTATRCESGPPLAATPRGQDQGRRRTPAMRIRVATASSGRHRRKSRLRASEHRSSSWCRTDCAPEVRRERCESAG